MGLLACVWLIGLWNAVPGNIVDGFQLYLVSLSTNTHSVGSLINLKHHRGNRHLPDYLLNLWRCHVPGKFLALDLKNLHNTLDLLHLLHLHNLFLSLHFGIRVRNVSVLGVVQEREP